MSSVAVEDLDVSFGDTRAVAGLSLTAEPGQVLALLGPNGAGKTTTVETMQGYRRPSSGRVTVLGLDPVKDRPRLAPRIGAMLQEGGVYPAMGAADAVRLFCAYYVNGADPDTLIDRLGLTSVARTPYRRLSGGEKQRLSLALALAGRPEVAFLDEPTAGVDPQGRLVIREVISELRSSGVCVILTTHELDEAERLADQIVIIDHGRRVAAGTADELMRGPGPEEIRFGGPASIDVAALAQRIGAAVVEDRPGEYIVFAPPRPATIASITSWLAERDLPLADLRAGRQKLEDVFLRLTSETAPADVGAKSGGRRRGRRGRR